jgi:hypothetical protein
VFDLDLHLQIPYEDVSRPSIRLQAPYARGKVQPTAVATQECRTACSQAKVDPDHVSGILIIGSMILYVTKPVLCPYAHGELALLLPLLLSLLLHAARAQDP